MFLSLDLPPTPLFKDEAGANVIPQVPLYTVLRKFDGVMETEELKGTKFERRRYKITKLPRYLVLALKRYTKNNFFTEKNPTIVTFPVKNLEMSEYLTEDADQAPLPSADAVPAMSVAQLKSLAARVGLPVKGAMDKSDLVSGLQGRLAMDADDELRESDAMRRKYNLVANVSHEVVTDGAAAATTDASGTDVTSASYRVQVCNRATGQWYDIRDLAVTETMPQLIGLSESYMMVYERQDYAAEAAGRRAAYLERVSAGSGGGAGR
jgi:U4/U6.U5 tri-snRNP-associated protein 2